MRKFRSGVGVAGLAVALVAASLLAVSLVSRATRRQDDCLIELHDRKGSVSDGGTLCAVARGNICTLDLQLCRNRPGCTPAVLEKTVRARGRCGLVGRLRITRSQSPCGAFAGIKVRTGRKGKAKGMCRIRVAATSSGRPARKDRDEITLVCMPEGGECPGAGAITTTTERPPHPPPLLPVFSFTTVAGTTSCGSAALTSPPSVPLDGELDSDDTGSAKITDLGLGCLYIGGGNGKAIPPGAIPAGATSYFDVSGTDVVASAGTGAATCTKGAGPTKHCVNDDAMPACISDDDCAAHSASANACQPDANCYFGPPLELPNPTLSAISACVINVVQTDAFGTVDVVTGSSSVTVPLSSRVYLTGNLGSPCPRCASGACTYGTRQGERCTTTSSSMTSVECPPELGRGRFQAPLALVLNGLTTGSSILTAADGQFCPNQRTAGAFGQTSARRIVETGSPAGDITDRMPHPATLGAAFCIPRTGNFTIDLLADLPAPGAISLTGNAQLH